MDKSYDFEGNDTMKTEMYRCGYCDAEWHMPRGINAPSKCPFCGKDRNGYYPDIILRKILQKYKNALFEDEKRFKAVISDLFCKDSGRAKRLIVAQRERLHRKYQEIGLCDDEVRKKVLRGKCISYMENELGMAQQYAVDLDYMFYMAFCGEFELEYADRDNTYYDLACEYQYDNDIDEAKGIISTEFYKIMAVSAYAGNIEAQKLICKESLRDWRLEWIDRCKVFEWANALYQESTVGYNGHSERDNHEGAICAAIIADSYAYEIGVQRDEKKAYEWYDISFQGCTFSPYVPHVQTEKLLRELCGIGCKKRKLEAKEIDLYERIVENLLEKYSEHDVRHYSELYGPYRVSSVCLECLDSDFDYDSLLNLESKVAALAACYSEEALETTEELEYYYKKWAFWKRKLDLTYEFSYYVRDVICEYSELRKELPKDENIYWCILEYYSLQYILYELDSLDDWELYEGIRYFENAHMYGFETDYYCIWEIYQVLERYDLAFEYFWNEYQLLKEDLDKANWDRADKENHRMSIEGVIDILSQLVNETEGKCLISMCVEDVIILLKHLERNSRWGISFYLLRDYILGLQDKDAQEIKIFLDYFSEARKKYQCCSVRVSNSLYGKNQGEQLLLLLQACYADRLWEKELMKSVSYYYELSEVLKEIGSRYTLLFVAMCRMCGLGIEKDTKEGIRLLIESYDESDYSYGLLYRLAHLLKEDNLLGETKVCADIKTANKILELAKEREDEKDIEYLGYDSSYTGFVSSLMITWNTKVISFYDYAQLSIHEDNKRLDVSNLALPDYIIKRLKDAGYTNILQLNNVKLSQAKKIPKLGKTSVMKIQRAMRDYFPILFWEERNSATTND